jgi:hypothetical protein
MKRFGKEISERMEYRQFLPLQQRERFTFTLLHLIEGALARGFVGTPAKKFCAVSKPSAGEMVVGNFNNYSGSDWFPFTGAVRAPTARSPGSAASKSRRFL